MSEKIRGGESEPVGFLPHEVKFVIEAIKKATEKLENANREYGEAVANSGGDWAFDDSASQVAAMDANFKERDLSVLRKLSMQIKSNGTISYPEQDSPVATYGSRITADEDGYVDTYDLTTHYIPGLRPEAGVSLVTPDAPIAEHLHGTKEGDTIKWQTPNGTDLLATIVKVDQRAVKDYYEEE